MHPAYSVILFTSLSGAGFGLLFWTCVLVALDGAAAGLGLSLMSLLTGVALASAGLIASLGHLGHPLRAWRAFSQWRSSWLSREGVLAVLALCATTCLIAALYWLQPVAIVTRSLAAGTAMLCMATVYATARIYSSLRTVPAWNLGVVDGLYLGCAVASGLGLSTLLIAWFAPQAGVLMRASALASGISLLALAWLFRHYWSRVDACRLPSLAHAIGLDALGPLRVFEAPHTESNYLLDEMGWRVARRHSARLRRLALVAGLLPSAGLWLIAGVLPPAVAAPLAALACVPMTLGIAVQRWLFFAEARHVVTAYYGRGDGPLTGA